MGTTVSALFSEHLSSFSQPEVSDDDTEKEAALKAEAKIRQFSEKAMPFSVNSFPVTLSSQAQVLGINCLNLASAADVSEAMNFITSEN